MTDLNSQPAKVLVAYYSATGHVHGLAKMIAQGAREAGGDVRVRHVEELAPELLISQNQAWGRHRSEVGEEPTATLADLEWADGIAFGTPTRFGNAAAQLKMFLNEAGGAVGAGQADQQGGDRVHLLANRARRAGVDDPRP